MPPGRIPGRALAVNLARGSRPVLRRNPPGVSHAVAQLVNVKNPGMARSYAGPVARAAPGGPLTWGPGPLPGGRSQVAAPRWPLPGGRSQVAAPRWPLPGGRSGRAGGRGAWRVVIRSQVNEHMCSYSLPG